MERLDLREKSINDLLPAEDNGCMFAGYNGYNMTFAKRKQVGKRYTFATNDPVAIRKGRRDDHNCIAAERAAIGT
jgi:DNA/RNA endonuclease YhcR with UshA esterase domain